MKVRVVPLPGMRGSGLCTTLEVFGGDQRDRGVPLSDVAAVSPSPEPRPEGGLRIRTLPLQEADGPDLLVIPRFVNPFGAIDPNVVRAVSGEGGVVPSAAIREDAARPGTARSGVVRDDVERAAAPMLRSHSSRIHIVSLCTGVFLLATTGLLDGADTTTHWCFCDELQRRHRRARVDPEVLYTHGAAQRLRVSAGVTAGIDAYLAILAQECRSVAAAAVARSMVSPAVRPESQTQFIPPLGGKTEGRASEGERLRAATLRNLATPWTAQTIADCAHTSPHTLHRRFLTETGMPPIRWLISYGVTTAQELLETTALGVEQIASRVGFGGAVSMRRHFIASVGMPPIEYHRAF